MSNPIIRPMLIGAAIGAGYGFLTQPKTPRRVFFSFHYQNDIWRVNQVKNHYVTKGDQQAAGYFDGSLAEKAKREGAAVVKKLIDDGLNGSSVLCVLIGSETYARHWVAYEIFKSIELGKGVFGVHIHGLQDQHRNTTAKGQNPFEYLGYGTDDTKTKMVPYTRVTGSWVQYPDCTPITAAAAAYLKTGTKPVLSELFPVYDWAIDDGFNNFASWASKAATHALR